MILEFDSFSWAIFRDLVVPKNQPGPRDRGADIRRPEKPEAFMGDRGADIQLADF